jgi:hypothetical protein
MLDKIARSATNGIQIYALEGYGLPVMVTTNETNKFWRRKNAGKYAVGTFELNNMFAKPGVTSHGFGLGRTTDCKSDGHEGPACFKHRFLFFPPLYPL